MNFDEGNCQKQGRTELTSPGRHNIGLGLGDTFLAVLVFCVDEVLAPRYTRPWPRWVAGGYYMPPGAIYRSGRALRRFTHYQQRDL